MYGRPHPGVRGQRRTFPSPTCRNAIFEISSRSRSRTVSRSRAPPRRPDFSVGSASCVLGSFLNSIDDAYVAQSALVVRSPAIKWVRAQTERGMVAPTVDDVRPALGHYVLGDLLGQGSMAEVFAG